jgi:hypothetical protein
MSSLPIISKRRFAFILIVAFVLATFAGCQNDGKLTVLDPRGQPSGLFGRVGEAGAGILANRNPETQPILSVDEFVPLRMAPRLDSLDNKTLYLVDVGFAGSREFFEEVQKWFQENMPSVKTVIHIKSNSAFEDSPELWPELKEKADGVVFGVGG